MFGMFGLSYLDGLDYFNIMCCNRGGGSIPNKPIGKRRDKSWRKAKKKRNKRRNK